MVGKALLGAFLLTVPFGGYSDLDKTVLPSKNRNDKRGVEAHSKPKDQQKKRLSGALGVGGAAGQVEVVKASPKSSGSSQGASPSDGKQESQFSQPKLGPIRWRADKLDVNDQSLTGTLVGSVRVFREDFDLRANKAIFFYKKGPERELDRIEAFGNVRMKKLDLANGLWTTGHSHTAEYFAEDQVLWLRGEAFVFRDKDKLFGDELKYNLATNQVEGSSVRGVANVKN